MSTFQQALRESGLIVLVAGALGFSYTATMEKGIFAEQAKSTQPLNAAIPGPQMIQLDEARRLFEEGNTLFIDARHEFDYQLGHIKGAMNIPLKEFDARISVMGEYPKEKLIIVYCDGAECNSSIEFASKMFVAGFSNVKIFFGGWREWQENNLPTEQEAPIAK